MLISLLHRLLVVFFLVPLSVHAMGTPRTGFHHIDIVHAGVDYSAQLVIELDTFCVCPDLVTLMVDIVNLTDESYEYQFRDSFILNSTRLLSFTLLPFVSLDDHRSVSIQLESDAAGDEAIQNLIYTLSPQSTDVERLPLVDTFTSEEPTITRYSWTGTKVNYYDQISIQTATLAHLNSPVIPLTKWVVQLDSLVAHPHRIAGELVLSSTTFSSDFLIPIHLIHQADGSYHIIPTHLISYVVDGVSHDLKPNSPNHRYDVVFGLPTDTTREVHFELRIPTFSFGRASLVFEADWQWDKPLFGACSESYYCLHQSTTPLVETLTPYQSFILGGD